MIWIKFLKHSKTTRILEFGNGMSKENIIITYSTDSFKLQFAYVGSTYKTCSLSNELNIGQWYHLAVKGDNKTVSILIDFVEKCSFDNTFVNVIRTKNYIGGSVWLEEGEHNFERLTAVVDEFKIFNRSLTIYEIKSESSLVDVIKVDGQLIHVLDSKRVNTNGLVHYWPMAGMTKDIIGGKDLIIIKNGKLAQDRFDNLNSGKFIILFKELF